MRFGSTLISTFLFASAVLADHSPEHRSSQFLDVVEKRTSASDFAGAILYASTPTFQTVTGIITVPDVSGPNGTGVGIFVGLDGGPDKPCRATLAAGLKCTFTTNNGPSCIASTYWYPSAAIDFTEFKVSYQDRIKVTVNMSDNKTTGYTRIEKLGDEMNNITQPFNNPQDPLCQLSAGWIVSKIEGLNLTYFDSVSFAEPMVYGDKEYTAGGSSVYDITGGDGKPLTTVEAYWYNITVREN